MQIAPRSHIATAVLVSVSTFLLQGLYSPGFAQTQSLQLESKAASDPVDFPPPDPDYSQRTNATQVMQQLVRTSPPGAVYFEATAFKGLLDVMYPRTFPPIDKD